MTRDEDLERDPDVRPTYDERGLALCDDACPNFDGKRCKATGFRPAQFCEPELIRQARLLAKLEGDDAEHAALQASNLERIRVLEEALETIASKWHCAAEGCLPSVNCEHNTARRALATHKETPG